MFPKDMTTQHQMNTVRPSVETMKMSTNTDEY